MRRGWRRAEEKLGAPEDVNRARHRIASANQHPMRMGAKHSVPHVWDRALMNSEGTVQPKQVARWYQAAQERDRGRRVSMRRQSIASVQTRCRSYYCRANSWRVVPLESETFGPYAAAAASRQVMPLGDDAITPHQLPPPGDVLHTVPEWAMRWCDPLAPRQ